MAPRPAAGSQTLGGSCSVRMSAVTAGAGVSYKSRPRSACVRRWTCVEWSSIGLRATPVSLPCRGGELGEHLVELGPAGDIEAARIKLARRFNSKPLPKATEVDLASSRR